MTTKKVLVTSIYHHYHWINQLDKKINKEAKILTKKLEVLDLLDKPITCNQKKKKKN